MKIFNSAGSLLLEVLPADSSVRYRSIMQDDSLTLNFSSVEPVVVPVGSYVDFQGQRYTLYYPENFKKHNTRNFEYTLVLHGDQEALKMYKFKDLSAKPYRLKFSLMAQPADFLQLLVDNMNEHDSGWLVGDCIEAEERLISLNHEYCYDVLNRLADEFDTEWDVEGKTIHLRKVERFKDDPLPLSYGKGNGFKSGVGRQNDGDKQPIGRLYVQGGERNIDLSTYGSTTLKLPHAAILLYDKKIYEVDRDGSYITRRGNGNTAEDSYDASHVYPKRVGEVSEVVVVDAGKNFYDIIDSSIPEDLDYSQYRIGGEKATIAFQSGALAGREFDIQQTDTAMTGYIHAERRFQIVPAEQDGRIMPGGLFVPAVGDKYAVFNITLPGPYIRNDLNRTGASWDMFREAVRYFAYNEEPKFTFSGELDGVWSKSKWLEIGGKIVPGGYILFSDPQFQPAGLPIRIVSIKDYINKPHKPEITLSNAPISTSFSADLGKLEAEEVVRNADKKEVIGFTKRQWRDTRETMGMLEKSLLNFSGSINPITVQTMQLLAGDESLQFRFVNNTTSPSAVNHTVVFNPANKVLTAAAGIIQHMTLGITTLKKTHTASEYRYWNMMAYTSPALDADKAYFLYARCMMHQPGGVFVLSEDAFGNLQAGGYYHFLVGILNSEHDGDRSFAPLYGFTEVLPGRITTDRIVSNDGTLIIDLLNNTIAGRMKFINTSGEYQDVDEFTDGKDAPLLLSQFAVSSTGPWQDEYLTGRKWMRTSNDDGATWSNPVKFVGDDGSKGADGKNGADGLPGKDGTGITKTTITYAKSTNGTTAPTSGWQAQPPAPTKGQYLWTKTVWTYSDTTTETGYSCAYWATDGASGSDGIAGKDGVGIVGTAITYAQSTSGTTAPTSGWQANPPTAVAGRYIWTKTVWTYSDGTAETGYSVGKIGDKGADGKDGKDGTNGTNGSDGVSVASMSEQWYLSTSSTTQAGGSWKDAIMEWTEGKTMWTRFKITMSDNSIKYTSPQKYSAAEALTKANEAAAKTKFQTEIDGGLIYSAMMKLHDAGGSGEETAGISGVTEPDGKGPSFWSGGTYAKAAALAAYLAKVAAGTTPGSTEYSNLANIAMLHDGTSKLGDLIVEYGGRIVMIDPITGKVRLAFDAVNLPLLSTLLDSNVGGGTTNIGSGSTSGSRTLSGSVEVAQGGSLTIAPTTITVSGSGRASTIGGLIHMASINTRLLLRRGLTTVATLGSVSIPFSSSSYENLNDSRIIQSATYTNLAAGTYTLVLEVVGSGDIATKTGTSTATTMTYNWSQEGVNIQQYGLNGMMFFFSDNHFYFTEDGGVDVRGKTNMPGILLSATVNSGGGFLDSWGAKKHASNTATKNSIGRYTVYHSIGHTNYQITASPTMANRSCHIVSKGISSFVIEWRTIGSSPALADAGFHFQITGDNYS